MVGDEFRVQVKGSDSPRYSQDHSSVGVYLKTTTVNWLLELGDPVMVCLCDTGHEGEPVFYVWLDEAVTEVAKSNAGWAKEERVRLAIPTEPVLDHTQVDAIAAHVTEWHEFRMASQELGGMVMGKAPGRRSWNRSSTAWDDHFLSFVKEVGIARTISADAGETLEVIPPEERPANASLNDISGLLRAYRLVEASEILDSVRESIQEASERTQARYYNSQGVWCTRRRDFTGALTLFAQAVALDPDEPKHQANLLSMELYLHYGEDDECPLPEDWDERLSALIQSHCEFGPAVRLKAFRIPETEGVDAASDYLQQSDLWRSEPAESRGILADIKKGADDLTGAVALLNEAEQLRGTPDLDLLCLKAHCLFLMAIRGSAKGPTVSWRGTAPPDVEPTILHEAIDTYEKALRRILDIGCPVAFEETVANHCMALVLAGRHGRAEEVARAYLARTDSAVVGFSLASVLLRRQENKKLPEAVQHAKAAYEAGVHGPLSYRRYLLALFAAGESEEVIRLAAERQTAGFRTDEEESITRLCSGVSHWDLGATDMCELEIKQLESNPNMFAAAADARATIAMRSHGGSEEAASIFRGALEEHPDNPELLSRLADCLRPEDPAVARELIDCLEGLVKARQLAEGEYLKLGRAHLILAVSDVKHTDTAVNVLKQGCMKYPEDASLRFELACALATAGEESQANTVWRECLELGERKSIVFQNLATIAVRTGRTRDAISFLHQALGRAGTGKERAQVHALLFELQRASGADAKCVLRHAAAFGENMCDEPRDIAHYIMMFMLAPSLEGWEDDPEVCRWVEACRQTSEKFFEAYPDFAGLRRVSVPKDASPEQLLEHLRVEVALSTLPHRLRLDSFAVAIRGANWPFVFRAEVLPEARNVFQFWSYCIGSRGAANAIHIWTDANDLAEEHAVAANAREVCVDISALLTLAEFELLYLLPELFELVVLPRQIEDLLSEQRDGLGPCHPLAAKLIKWINESRCSLRFRRRGTVGLSEQDKAYRETAGGVFLPEKPTIDKVLLYGTGEAILLAQDLSMPLYCDQSAIRSIAHSEFDVTCFSTLSMLNRLRDAGRLPIAKEARQLAAMIEKNFRVVPFTPLHMHARLSELREDLASAGRVPSSDDMRNDAVLGVFLGQFSDRTLTFEARCRVAVGWWLTIAEDEQFNQRVLDEAMRLPSFSLIYETEGGLIAGLDEKEPQKKAALVWAVFLWRAFGQQSSMVPRAWSAVKTAAEQRCPNDELMCNAILYEHIPRFVTILIEATPDLTDDEKAYAWVHLPLSLPSESRARFQHVFSTQHPSFRKD